MDSLRLSFSEAQGDALHLGFWTVPVKFGGMAKTLRKTCSWRWSGSHRKRLKAPEESGSFQLLTGEEPGWLPKDLDKQLVQASL